MSWIDHPLADVGSFQSRSWITLQELIESLLLGYEVGEDFTHGVTILQALSTLSAVGARLAARSGLESVPPADALGAC